MGRELTAPNERLIAAAKLAAAIFFEDETSGSLRAIDVGCDHGKLAIYLVQSGICSHVLASDIGEGPLEKAREAVARRHFKSEPLANYITVRQNDGLCGFDDVPAERIFILGMGGELIASILERAAFLHDPNRKTVCILQAMTSETDLRHYLATHGFAVLRETLVKDKGRIYSLIACRYDGKERSMSEAELCVGTYHVSHPDKELFLPYIDRKIRILSKKIAQMTQAGLPCDADKDVLCELQKLRETAIRNMQKTELQDR